MNHFRAKAFFLVLAVSQMPGTHLRSSPSSLQQKGDGDASSAAAPLAMSEAHRKFIWDIEHWVFILDHKVFPKWVTAFVENDRSVPLEAFSRDFSGQVLQPSSGSEINTASGRYARIREATARRKKADASEIVDYLLEYRNRFMAAPGSMDRLIRFFAPAYASSTQDPPRVQVAMMELAPAEREKPAGPWRGTMKVRFTGRTTDGSVAEALIKASDSGASLGGPAGPYGLDPRVRCLLRQLGSQQRLSDEGSGDGTRPATRGLLRSLGNQGSGRRDYWWHLR